MGVARARLSDADGGLLVASGGDDGALTVTCVTLHGGAWTTSGKTVQTSAHAAQITGGRLW